jgi:hypothetical protein
MTKTSAQKFKKFVSKAMLALAAFGSLGAIATSALADGGCPAGTWKRHDGVCVWSPNPPRPLPTSCPAGTWRRADGSCWLTR